MSRLVMVHGVCWGAGQSTLTRRLAAAIPNVDVLWEDELSQPAFFSRGEFAEVADRFRRHNEDRSAGIGHPPAPMIENAYRSLVQTALAHGRPLLMGWSVMDLAEDLDWAEGDQAALDAHARVAREVFAPLDPVLVYIDAEVPAALQRAVDERGRDWFARAYAIPAEQWADLEARLVAEGSTAADRIRHAFDAGGWLPALEVDSTLLGVDDVFDAVAAGLRERNVHVDHA